jgi:hypothetical protein
MRFWVNRCALAIAVSLILASCGPDGGSSGTPTPPAPVPTPAPPPTPTPTPSPAQVEREILPSSVDPVLPASDAANFVINPNPAVAVRGRLFVMLPGTGGIPRNYRTIVRTGAGRGYHSIGLTYPNAVTVGDLCAGTTDPDCTGNTRREIITGENLSSVVAVDVTNSIVMRLTLLLTSLNRTYPTEGWGQYLKNGAVDWSLVTVAGHSQGSGHAAYMAKLYSLDRSVMFSGPSDVPTAGSSAAKWFSLPNVTPVSRQYGFTHIDDELVPYALVRNNWNAIGLEPVGTAPALVDGFTAPYGGAHKLYTAASPSALGIQVNSTPRHNATAVDVITPTDAQGLPLYAPVWTYLAFP